MKSLKRIFRYLINPRSGTWLLSDQEEVIQPRKVPWKGILNPPFVLGTLIVLVLIVIVWFGPNFASYDPYITSRSVTSYFDTTINKLISPPFGPSPEYPLGTDYYGNDILSSIFYGARVTLISSVYITAGRMLLGLVLGGISGWTAGSRFDRLITRLSVVISSIPLLLSAMLMILALDIQKGLWVFVVSLSILGWTEIAQIVRGEFIRIKEMPYIDAAKALGLTRLQIITRHALPNVLSYLLSISFLEMGSILLIMAELGFLRIFIGGGSRIMGGAFASMVLIPEIPEWGALVTQAASSLRPYPYMILGPAAAFFITIVGLNAFGEGLRRIFDAWPFSTAFILKKRMLLIIAAFVVISLIIFRMTDASVSYQRAAETFSEESVIARYEELKIYNSISRESEDNPVIEYIIRKSKEYGIQPGWGVKLNKYHNFPVSVTLLRPRSEPKLVMGNQDHYHFGNEFSYLTELCAGAGNVQAPVVFLGGLSYTQTADLFGDKLRGKIVMILEEGTTPENWEEAKKLGIEGMLLITTEQPPLSSQYEVNSDPADENCQMGSLPVYRIPGSVARSIFSEAGKNWDEALSRATKETFIIDLSINGLMELDLKDPQTIEVPNTIGFIGGYDFDHADEIIVIYTTFDGLGLSEFQQEKIPEDDLAKIAILLEIMHVWDEKQVDPRRSVQFVIWGGEGIQEPYYEMIYGLFELNKLVAKVPTNTNPNVNENPVKPAIWVEIGDLSASPGLVAFSDTSTKFLSEILRGAARATNIEVHPAVPLVRGVNSGLPYIYLWEERVPEPTSEPDYVNYVKKGVLINRTLIQLLRDMSN